MSAGSSSGLLVEPDGAGVSVALVDGEVSARSPLQLVWRRLRGDRVALTAGTFIVFLILVAIAAPLIIKLLGLPAPNVQDPSATDAFGSPLGPASGHPLGVDELGRDVLSRIIYGSRVSLEVGILGTALAALLGTVLGLLAGFYRGWVDTAVSRSVDVFLAFPVLVLGLGIGAACGVRGCLSGLIAPGIGTVLLIIAMSTFTYIPLPR
ncbi:MAG: hypothetical protein M3Y09_11875 [Actinomycetota bacterium]|nr:hypothetical protein [Actinomycetota bacterium]